MKSLMLPFFGTQCIYNSLQRLYGRRQQTPRTKTTNITNMIFLLQTITKTLLCCEVQVAIFDVSIV